MPKSAEHLPHQKPFPEGTEDWAPERQNVSKLNGVGQSDAVEELREKQHRPPKPAMTLGEYSELLAKRKPTRRGVAMKDK